MQQCSLMGSSRAVSFLTETRNARRRRLNVSTSLPSSFYCDQLRMGVGHTGIVIQLLHVGCNIAVTRLFICRDGKQDGPITLTQIYFFLFFYPLDVWPNLASRSSPQLSGLLAAAHRFTEGSITAGKTQFGGCRWCCCCGSVWSVETRDERGGGGGIWGPTTKHSAPNMNSSDPKSRSHEQTVVDESWCALRGNMRACFSVFRVMLFDESSGEKRDFKGEIHSKNAFLRCYFGR